tara:strand:- start:10922 stop:11890 length:969 start_codon:yes stop_codon:yes gene_type:complete
MMKALEILKILADGEFHSGQAIGEQLGITRTSIWNHIKGIEAYGYNVDSLPGKGYRISGGTNLLDVDALEAAFPNLKNLMVFSEIDSTNQYLLDNCQSFNDTPVVCLAEYQRAGKARRGRKWESPFGKNLYCSVAYQFETGVNAIAGLSLAIGVVVAQTLEHFGLQNVQLKWPNDVYVNGKKVVGILVEFLGEVTGPCDVVVGVGININKPQQDYAINQDWTCMETALGQSVDRTAFSCYFLQQLLQALDTFKAEGFAAFHQQWQHYDCLIGKEINAEKQNKSFTAKVLGLDNQGNLIVSTKQGETALTGGEVSVRPVKSKI